MIPQHDHPLTLAYVAGARVRDHKQMGEIMRLIRSLETDAPRILIDQCRLAADITLERTRHEIF